MPIGPYRLLAHRGAARTSPENTLEAFARARDEGADGIELDVQLTRDGEPFLFHDDDARRAAGVRARVGELSWREVSALRVFGGLRVPHLEDALAAFEAWPGAELFVDLHQDSLRLAERVARSVARSPAKDRIFILEFWKNRGLLLRAREEEPSVRLALMPGPPWNTDACCRLGAAAVCLGWDGPLTRRLYRAAGAFYDVAAAVGRARAAGVAVSGGVANTAGEVEELVALGIREVWTDDLALARGVLEGLARVREAGRSVARVSAAEAR